VKTANVENISKDFVSKLMVRPDYARFVIRDSSKHSQFSIHIRFANNRHVHRFCTRHL